MEPSYTIVPLLKKSSIKPGEIIEIDLFLSGYGPIERSKLHLTHGYTELLDDENPGRWIHSIAGTVKEDGQVEPEFVPDGHPLKSRELSKMGGYTHLNPAHFIETGDIDREVAEGSWEDVDRLPGIYGERAIVPEKGKHVTPLSIEYNTKSEAAPGDYDINLVFTYEGPNKIHQSEKAVNVHVENWVERNRRLLQGTAAVAAILTVVSIVFPFIASVVGL